MSLLAGVRVVDFSEEIAGPYCTKLLADAGADVVKIEPVGGDRLRRWSASGAELGDADGALFQFLNTTKRSVVAEFGDPAARELVAAADLVVESGRLSPTDIETILHDVPRACVVSLSPFGVSGPWASRPATEFTLQGWCGSTASRGTADREPLHAGGRLGEWIGGVYAAVGAVAALREARRSGMNDHVDVSLLEAMAITMGSYAALHASLGAEPPFVPERTVEIPSIEPTADGYVGFCTITAQQVHDFLMLIERPDLCREPELSTFMGRYRRRDEFVATVREWTSKHTTAEIVERASRLRIPVAQIGTPETLTTLEHFVDRGVYVTNPGGGFLQPRPPYRIEDLPLVEFRPAPRLGEHNDPVQWTPRPAVEPTNAAPRRLPLDGIRIIDFTLFWAGPLATELLGALGADVIKVESIQRPDGMRFSARTRPTTMDGWWEWSSIFQAINANKRSVTIDFTQEEGRALIFELIARCDAVVENFSPRVLDNAGITWAAVREHNPSAVMVRMPAFGLSGPWRDRPGFAQTTEQTSGLAWMTGFADGPPTVPRGPCDPLSGLHGAFALLCALEERDRSGRGHFIESTMVETALNAAAELVLEHSAYGATIQRDANRGPVAAPQAVYRCQGDEQWLAVAVTDDAEWSALRALLGDPAWARADDLATASGRRAAHDLIDEHLAQWCATRDLDPLVDALLDRGIPAAPVVSGRCSLANPQVRARGFAESIDHPITGRHEIYGLPFRFKSRAGQWFTRPSPTLGQHNRDVLGGMLGHSDEELAGLASRQVIGTTPLGA